jgi:hypothetical protein
MIPTMTPNNPRALPKIYTTNIFIKLSGYCASAIAHPLPVIPTHTLNYNYYTHMLNLRNLL